MGDIFDRLSQAPKKKKDIFDTIAESQKVQEPNLVDTVLRPFKAQSFKAAEALNSGMAAFSENLDSISQYIEQKTGLSRGGLFENAAKTYNENADYWKRKAEDTGTNVIDEIVGEATGGALPGISEFLLNVPYSATLGAAEAYKRGDSEVGGAIIEGTKRAFLGQILKIASILKQPLRAGTMGTVFAGQTVGEGGDIREAAKSFAIGSLYSVGGEGKVGLREIREAPRTVYNKKTAKQIQGQKPISETKKIYKDTTMNELGERAAKGDIKGVTEALKNAEKKVNKLALEDAFAKQMSKHVVETPKGEARNLVKKNFAEIDSLWRTPEQPKGDPNGARITELVRQRSVNINKALLDSEAFITKTEVKLTKAEREALPFIRQGIKDPTVLTQIGKEELIPIIEKPSSKLKEATEEVGKYYDEAHQFLKDNWNDPGFVENYVTHVWDIPKNRKSWAVNYFATKNPFLKARTIPTLEDGIKIGLKPKTTDIAELLRIYDQQKIKTVYNFKFAEELKTLRDSDGNPLVMRADKAPEDWVTVDHPALRRAMATGKATIKGVEVPILSKVPVKVHPEIAGDLKVVFDKPFSHPAIKALETINAVAKKSMLSISLFHHLALTEAAFSSGIGSRTVKLWNPYKIYDALKNKNYEIFKKQELAKDGIEHGLTFGALSDVQRSVIVQGLNTIERKTKDIPGLKHVTKGMKKGNEMWDAALWDYYHNTLKLQAYEHQVAKELKRQNPQTPEKIKAVKTEIAELVNNTFGGQNWDLKKVLGQPKIRQMIQWTLLAPDWTISTLKQAAAPIKGAVKGERATTARGTLFWMRAALYYNLIAQTVNYTMTEKKQGEGRFTWDNPPGKKLDIYAGQNPDGTEKYIRMGKQFREVFDWITEPINTVGKKLSPTLREGLRQLTKHDPGSGFPTDYADYKEFWSGENILARIKSVAEMPLPFSIRPYINDRPQNFLLSLPASKGMTRYRARELFKEALENNDKKAVEELYVHALRNGIDPDVSLRSAMQGIKTDITYESRDLANKLWKELSNLQGGARPNLNNLSQEQKDLFEVYRKQKILNSKIMGEIIKINKHWIKIDALREKFNIKGGK